MDFQANFSIRTDLADEARKLWQGRAENKGDLPGVTVRTSTIHSLDLTEIEILDEAGEKELSKARGKYFSLSLPTHFDRGSEYFGICSKALAQLLQRCAGYNFKSVLVAALGNPDITPDALGSLAASHILVTRHLSSKDFPQFNSLALCRPGVLGTSGIESALQVKTLCQLIKPELVIVIDALAGSDANRLCRCIQISDAGISPGSGVGNDRHELSRKTLGVPVISIGMPTVIDASHFGGEEFSGMFVTPRDIDSSVRQGARLIGYGINLAVHRGLDSSDIDALLG